MSVGDSKSDRDEMRSLRAEMMVRIIFQNILILLCLALFAIAGFIAAAVPGSAIPAAFCYSLTCLFLAAAWCHHGVRQAQIKTYVMRMERRQGRLDSWESWLPHNRLGGWLGSRWVISTKLPLVVLPTAATVWAAHAGGAAERPLLLVNAVLIAIGGWLLWTNPREKALTPSPVELPEQREGETGAGPAQPDEKAQSRQTSGGRNSG